MAEQGHNVGEAGKKLSGFVERLEKLQAEKKGIVEDMNEIMLEAKGNGLDPKIIRHVMRRRKMEAADRREFDELVDLYEHALETLLS